MKEKILVIEPHSDDSFIAAGGFFIKNKDRYDFNFSLISASNQALYHGSSTREERLSEYGKFVDYLSGTWHRGDLPLDCESKLDTVNKARLVKLIEAQIQNIEPDIIMTMGPSAHHDHTAVYEAVIAATRPTFSYNPRCIWIMENSTYVHKAYHTITDTPNVYIELSEEIMNRKEKLFSELFTSQLRPSENCLSAKGMRDWARYRGIEARCLYAEAFYQLYKKI